MIAYKRGCEPKAFYRPYALKRLTVLKHFFVNTGSVFCECASVIMLPFVQLYPNGWVRQGVISSLGTRPSFHLLVTQKINQCYLMKFTRCSFTFTCCLPIALPTSRNCGIYFTESISRTLSLSIWPSPAFCKPSTLRSALYLA